MATIHTATDDSFQQDVLESGTPVLVDFWAEWCGPCKMIAPVLEQLSEEYGDDLKIVKVNVDENSMFVASQRLSFSKMAKRQLKK